MAENVPPSPKTPSSSSAAPLGISVILNKLQDILAQYESQSTIKHPHGAVVGSQSSGKSSVLEALVGRDFIPRGSDICTLRPLVLQLLQTKNDEEYGEFLHLPGKRFLDFSDIRREIQEAGRNKCVSDEEIRLDIFSPNVLDVTLIDFPGIAEVPVGDQPSDIEARIRTMIMSYINVPSCLIIVVIPANSDLANSDALQMARNADPDGLRTIGVITKLDIMDRGTDARNLLLGKVIPLRLGCIGVVNRSQEDILLNRSIKDALLAEENFFRSRPVYDGLADRCGVPQLTKKLNQILVQHIKTVLLGLKSQISSALVSVAKKYDGYGDIPMPKFDQAFLHLNNLSKYSEGYFKELSLNTPETPPSPPRWIQEMLQELEELEKLAQVPSPELMHINDEPSPVWIPEWMKPAPCWIPESMKFNDEPSPLEQMEKLLERERKELEELEEPELAVNPEFLKFNYETSPSVPRWTPGMEELELELAPTPEILKFNSETPSCASCESSSSEESRDAEV